MTRGLGSPDPWSGKRYSSSNELKTASAYDEWGSWKPSMQSHGLKADMTHYVTAELLAPTKAMQIGACLLRAGVEGGASLQVAAALACAMFKMIMNEHIQAEDL